MDAALDLARELGEPFWDAELMRLKAVFTLAADPAATAAAEDLARAALAEATARGAGSLALRAATTLGQLLVEEGRAAEAGPPLAGALAAMHDGGETADALAARALLDSAANQRPRGKGAQMTGSAQTPPATGSPVYCSGPMFSIGDKREQHAVAKSLEAAGFTTYLPQRDGIEVGRVMALVNHPFIEGRIADDIMLEVRKWVFALDMFQLLERCQSLVFNLDGRTPDDGSVVETAAAFTAGKPLVIYKTSPITMLAGADNPMVTGLSSSWKYVEQGSGRAAGGRGRGGGGQALRLRRPAQRRRR